MRIKIVYKIIFLVGLNEETAESVPYNNLQWYQRRKLIQIFDFSHLPSAQTRIHKTHRLYFNPGNFVILSNWWHQYSHKKWIDYIDNTFARSTASRGSLSEQDLRCDHRQFCIWQHCTDHFHTFHKSDTGNPRLMLFPYLILSVEKLRQIKHFSHIKFHYNFSLINRIRMDIEIKPLFSLKFSYLFYQRWCSWYSCSWPFRNLYQMMKIPYLHVDIRAGDLIG